ncbi:MAG: AraC family transcriptional regulator, partial [Mycobacterium sp.]|nr:AraC family transcriptional regulator [Mycobacterium sp.]
PLRELAECVWTSAGPRHTRVLPDGCMDLIEFDGDVVVAGPDTTAHLATQQSAAFGLRFRPGALPRVLGVPAAALCDLRVPLRELRPELSGADVVTAALRLRDGPPQTSTAPWSLSQLRQVTARLAAGTAVRALAEETGCSPRNLQRHCVAVYGYPPSTLRRVLRFRRALGLIGSGMPPGDVAAAAGYADQPHLCREVRDLAGVPIGQLDNAANRSTEIPSGSTTVA